MGFELTFGQRAGNERALLNGARRRLSCRFFVECFRSELRAALVCCLTTGLFLWTAYCDNITSAELFPNGCSVVLLNGIAGDVESENSFHEQMQGWLDLAAQSRRVKKLFLLSDNAEGLNLPKLPECQAFKADRKQFLTLASELKATRTPLVVISWGHGGKQGSTPVLHVRGPRLTSEDFASFSKEAAAPESEWILLFRGSGAFGQALAGENRRVITSEAQTMFSSDPVGMPMLLKLAAGGNKTFDELADDFGRAVTEWYQSRGLARTEEPTLWKEQNKVVLLAKTKSQEPAQGGAEDIPLFAEDKRTKTEPIDEPPHERPSAQQPAPADLGTAADWKSLKRISPEQYPEADGVVLLQRSRTTLGSNPAIVTDREEFIQILKPEGKRFGDFDISYSPPHEEVQFQACEVQLPDGKVLTLDPEKIADAREQNLGDYQAPHRKMFSLPGVGPGAVLHVRFLTQWREFPLPRISLDLPVGHELPTVNSAVQVVVPKSSAFHFAFQHVEVPDPEVKSTAYGTTYSWKLENIPAHQNESLTAPRQTPKLMVSTFRDWKEFAEWYERISRMTDETTAEIAAQAKSLTADAKTDKEKLIALYNYVTGLRYVALPLGINSVRPHAAANVLRNQFGDCKDKANLLNAMLRSLDIDAHLVLVPRFSQALESVPGLAFNHAISQVKLGSETIYLDTTDDICRFGLLPPGDPGRNVLAIGNGNSMLVQLTTPEARDHRLKISGEIVWADAAEGAPTDLKAEGFGYPDYQLRASARDAREHRTSLPLLAARFRPVNGAFAMETQQATPVSALGENFTWSARGTWVGLSTRNAKTGLLRSPFWVPREWDTALNQRHAPLFLNQGYPLMLEQEMTVTLPRGANVMSLPRFCENSDGPLRWRIEWSRKAPDKIVARMVTELNEGELSAAETTLFQDQLRMLIAAASSECMVETPQ